MRKNVTKVNAPMLRAFFASILALAAISCSQAPQQAEVPPPEPAPTDTPTWAVTTAHPLATKAGANILSAGGSAADAAVAVQAVLGLVEPQSSGLGGGAFMLHYDANTGELTSFDGREIAPASAIPGLFLKENGTPMGFYDAVTSGYSVGVPGAVAMLGEVHSQYGKMPWADLFVDAEQLAQTGFPMTDRMSSLAERMVRLKDNDAPRALYFDDSGIPHKGGTVITNPAYAETIRQIAQGGAGAFYQGPIANAIVAAVNEKTGTETLKPADLAAYKPTERAPVCGPFLTYKVCTMGPPSSGGVTLLQILGLVEKDGRALTQGPKAWAQYVEASRLAYADRDLYLGDPIAMGDEQTTADDIVSGLISAPYLHKRAKLIGDEAAEMVEPGDPLAAPLKDKRAPDASPNLPGTSHFSIRDQYGNIVSMTTTVETAFGSHLMAGGMLLNNQLTDFSFLPERNGIPVVNAVAPGKKPRSSMTPVVVFDEEGAPVMAIGSPGGPAIIGYVAKTLLASLAWEMDLQAAIDLPNVVTPRGKVLVEDSADASLVEALNAYGYDVTNRALTSGLYGFAITEDSIQSGVDPRRDGTFLSDTTQEPLK
ncbi:MAG: gamma-glutamyltransferase family protein [Pseudomonadota bacterium]